MSKTVDFLIVCRNNYYSKPKFTVWGINAEITKVVPKASGKKKKTELLRFYRRVWETGEKS